MFEELKDIVGEKNFSDNLIDRYIYASDASIHQSLPSVVVRPASAEEIQKIIRYANKEKIPVIARGAGTGEAGSAVPIDGGVVLDLKRMNKIKEIRIGDLLCRVEPGVVNDELNRELKESGFFFPPTPGSGKVCTIGGMIANNASGIRAIKYGATRDSVLGLKVVLPQGELVSLGTQTIIHSSGYQLARLIVGSEGTLGIIVEATIRLKPLPEKRAVGKAVFHKLEDAGKAISAIIAGGITPSALEILDEIVIKAINKVFDIGLPEAEAMILFECDGNEASIDYEVSKIKKVCQEFNSFSIDISNDPEEMEKIWEVRSSAFPASSRYKEDLVRVTLAEDVAVPVSKVSELVTGIHKIASKNGIIISTYGHAGEGLIHPNFLINPELSEQWEKAKKAASEVFAFAQSLGGTTSGEHGIGISKASYFKKERKNSLDMMRRIKKALDPNNILNPHKLMDAPEDFLTATKIRYRVNPVRESSLNGVKE
ncbi:MAG: FAD-binding oxidoreductase [Candidatus Aerophobetes bacterium]|nr:FAD-binding oxidoreductase [Candidatus Aerophobetes bacterium]